MTPISGQNLRSRRRPLLLLVRDPALRDVFRTAVSREFDVVLLPHWTALRAYVEERAPSALVVVDPYFGAAPGEGPAPELRRFLLDFPFTTAIAALRTGPGRYDDVRVLGRWGIHEVISLEQERTPEAVAHRLEQASVRLSEAALRGVLDVVPEAQGRHILTRAVEHAAGSEPAEELAAELKVSRRTLLRWCESLGLPPPRRLLAWIRVLMAAQMLQDPARQVSAVARLSGYTSDNALRTTLQKFLGKTPKELREGDAFGTAAAAFRKELVKYRKDRMSGADGESYA